MERKIEIRLMARPAKPLPELNPGDTIKFVTSDGTAVRVEFESEPPDTSRKMEVKNKESLTLIEGKFFCKCFITRNDGEEIGWSKDNPDSGFPCDIPPTKPI